MAHPHILNAFQDATPHHHSYCISTTHTLMSCNDQQAIDLGYKSEQAIIGKSLHQLNISKTNLDTYIAFNEIIFRNGKGSLFFEPCDTLLNMSRVRLCLLPFLDVHINPDSFVFFDWNNKTKIFFQENTAYLFDRNHFNAPLPAAQPVAKQAVSR